MASRKYLSLIILLLFINKATSSQKEAVLDDNHEQSNQQKLQPITTITVKGLSLLPEETILSCIPYQIGDYFDKNKTSRLIQSLYTLGYFKQVKVYSKQLSGNGIEIILVLEEKTPIQEILFEGNKHLQAKDIFKKTDLEKKPAIETKELAKYAQIIKKLYKEKNYHFAEVIPKLTIKNGKGIVTFKVKEGIYARVQKVRFLGNKTFTDKKLRSLLFTREDWILGILDKSGTFNPLACEQDRYNLEYFYQSNGFINVKVGEPIVEFDKKQRNITVTFPIEEGDRYTVSSVKTPGIQEMSDQELADSIPVRAGQLYSRELIRLSIEKLRTVWGKQGYIYADIEPSIQPDEETKKVDITFHSDPGNKVYLNCINIFGNTKTRDKVIRRQLTLEDGDLITTDNMDLSKNKVAHLGYFDQQEGVNWKIERLDKNLADLNLLVKEIKTGKFLFQANYGGTPGKLATPGNGMSIELTALERNLLGLGLEGQITSRVGNGERSFFANFTEPWFCDKPIRVGFDAYLTHSTYDELRKVKETVREKRMGGSMNAGFIAKSLFDTGFLFDIGLEKIDHQGKKAPQANISNDPSADVEYQMILDSRFKGGSFTYLQMTAQHDTRNHHMHISRGHKLNLFTRVGIPAFHDPVGFYKIQADAHWYTPIIGETALVLHLHGHAGCVTQLNGKRIPFRELYNIGGQASVRGWEFGQIGPMWYVHDQVEDNGWQGEAIGGKKGMFLNSELIFPCTEDLSIKGAVFYDGGTGWDTPNADLIDPARLKNNSFDYRHSIGFGVRLLQPQPIRIDWGFKLDKREGESLSEVHFSTYHDF